MKLDDRFPQPVRLTIGPHPDVYPDPALPVFYAGGHYNCDACKSATGWRVCVEDFIIPACSTECVEQLSGVKITGDAPAKLKKVVVEAPTRVKLELIPPPKFKRRVRASEVDDSEKPPLPPEPAPIVEDAPPPSAPPASPKAAPTDLAAKLTKAMIAKILERKK